MGAPSTAESVGAPDPPGDRCAIQIEDYFNACIAGSVTGPIIGARACTRK